MSENHFVHQSGYDPAVHRATRRDQTIRQNGVNQYESSEDSGEEYYSSSEYTDSSEDNDPLWQDEPMKAGEMFYIEDNPTDSEEPQNFQQEKNGVSGQNLPENDNAVVYKTAMPKKQVNEVPIVLKVVYIGVNPVSSYSQGMQTNLLAKMLGIIMLDMDINDEMTRKRQGNVKINVDVLVPGSAVYHSGQVGLGDNLVAVNEISVNTGNIESVLQSIRKPATLKLTFETAACVPTPTVMAKQIAPIRTNFCASSESSPCIVTLLTPHSNRQKQSYSLDGPYGVFYLTLNVRSETAAENDDLLYSYPSIEAAIAPSKLVQIRGAFVTLSDILQETFSSKVLSTTLMIDDEVVHCAYHHVGTEVLMVCVPAKAYSLPETYLAMANIVRLLNVMYGSLVMAFQPENKQRLDHMFSFALILNSSSTLSGSLTTGTSFKFPGVKQLTLSTELQGHVDSALAELEASDFDDGSKAPNYTRRLYTVRGSCVFYDGYLLANHLPLDDLYDVSLFCYNHNLLGVRNKERIGLLIIWREVFRWCKRTSDKVKDGFEESNGRYFLLIVGLKHSLLCTLLQLNGKLFPPAHTPRPDNKYVNHARAALINLESCNFYNYMNQRLCQPSSILLSSPEQCLQQSGSLFQTTKPSQSPGTKQGKGFKLPFNSPLKPKNTTVDTNESQKPSPVRPSTGGEMTKSTRRGLFREKSFSSQGSGESGDSTKQTKPTPEFIPENTKEISNSLNANAAEQSYHSIIRVENSMFCYLTFDPLQGILIIPTEYDMSLVYSEAFKDITENFKKYVLILHQRLVAKNEKSDYCVEEGVLFQYSASKHFRDVKKKVSFLQYWIIGRIMKKPVPREFYVCFHNSAPQSVVELAFKSGFCE